MLRLSRLIIRLPADGYKNRLAELVEADVVDGRTVTSWPSVRTDLENAGADVVDEEVVVDDNLITSRKPDDIPAFNKAIIAALTQVAAGENA